MIEYSWALTGIVGLSLMGQLIAATNWRTPFFVLSVGLFFFSFAFRTLPSVRENVEPRQPTQAARSVQPPSSTWQRILGFFTIHDNAASAYATIVATMFTFYGAMQLMIAHGIWYADQYGFGPRELGYVALLFGCFDLVGSVAVSLFTDRFGKRRSVILGTTGALLGYLLIPWLNIAVVPAVLSAALARGFFEFAIVANIPLLSGQSPNQRAKVMTLSAACVFAVSTLANFTAPAMYTRFGITGITLVSAVCTAVALTLLLTRVREQPATADGISG